MNDGRSDNHTFFQLPRNAMLNPPQIAHGPHRSGRSLMSKVEPTAWRWSMAVRVTATIWPLGWWKQSIAIGWPIQKHCTRKKKMNFPWLSRKIPWNCGWISCKHHFTVPAVVYPLSARRFLHLSQPHRTSLGTRWAIEGSADPHPPAGYPNSWMV